MQSKSRMKQITTVVAEWFSSCLVIKGSGVQIPLTVYKFSCLEQVKMRDLQGSRCKSAFIELVLRPVKTSEKRPVLVITCGCFFWFNNVCYTSLRIAHYTHTSQITDYRTDAREESDARQECNINIGNKRQWFYFMEKTSKNNTSVRSQTWPYSHR